MNADGVKVDRVFEVSDELVDAVARLLPQLSTTAKSPDRAALEKIVASEVSSMFVARLTSDPDHIAGVITLLVYRIPSGVHAVVEDVVVDESARGHGVGAAMLDEAVELARSRGALHVNLTSRSSREAANRLYKRKGFVIRETNVYRLNLS
jgi:ribosomal protein S18 acetylase RimI-like enzyme